jgi:periplasmic protein TonB
MEPLAILRADTLDLLFENRNKAYGAYPLRKYYPQRLCMSLGLIFSLVTVFSLFYLNRKSEIHHKPVINVGDFHLTAVDPSPLPKTVIPPVRPFVPRPPASVELVTPLITRQKEIIPPMATVEDLGKNVIGMQTLTGQSGGEQVQPEGNYTGAAGIKKDSVESIPEILDHPEIMPEFPGGEDALRRFLHKNLRMPDNNLENGTRVKVIARFVVGNDGRVRDIEITQAADEAFNREVKRVILKMPDWKPGMQHNRKVAVYFSLPVNFVNEE